MIGVWTMHILPIRDSTVTCVDLSSGSEAAQSLGHSREPDRLTSVCLSSPAVGGYCAFPRTSRCDFGGCCVRRPRLSNSICQLAHAATRDSCGTTCVSASYHIACGNITSRPEYRPKRRFCQYPKWFFLLNCRIKWNDKSTFADNGLGHRAGRATATSL